MLVKDVMTTNVVTIPSSTSIGDAKRIMKEHKFRRLPVVRGGKLVGVVTEDRLERVEPPAGTPILWQIHYLLSRTTVRDIMSRKVVTTDPNATVEQAVALAQANNVGSLIIVEDKKVVGIVTTNDFFYRIVNPTLGLGEPGTRIIVPKGGDGKVAEKIVGCINKLGIGIRSLWMIAPAKGKKRDLVIHLETEDATPAIEALKEAGISASLRPR